MIKLFTNPDGLWITNRLGSDDLVCFDNKCLLHVLSNKTLPFMEEGNNVDIKVDIDNIESVTNCGDTQRQITDCEYSNDPTLKYLLEDFVLNKPGIINQSKIDLLPPDIQDKIYLIVKLPLIDQIIETQLSLKNHATYRKVNLLGQVYLNVEKEFYKQLLLQMSLEDLQKLVANKNQRYMMNIVKEIQNAYNTKRIAEENRDLPRNRTPSVYATQSRNNYVELTVQKFNSLWIDLKTLLGMKDKT
jgi:hypothetical protein